MPEILRREVTRNWTFAELETERTKTLGEPLIVWVTWQPRSRQIRFIEVVLRLACTRSCVLAAAAGLATARVSRSSAISLNVRFMFGASSKTRASIVRFQPCRTKAPGTVQTSTGQFRWWYRSAAIVLGLGLASTLVCPLTYLSPPIAF